MMRETFRTKRPLLPAWVLALVLSGAAWWSQPAHAQFGLPPEIVAEPGELTAAQRTQIESYVSEQIAKLETAEADIVKRGNIIKSGKDALLSPLTARASVPFRIAYSEVLEPRLAALIRDGNGQASKAKEQQQVNALFIGGELGTKRSLDLIALGRGSATDSVRFQSAAAARRVFDNLKGQANNAISPEDLRTLLNDTGRAVATETAPRVKQKLMEAIAAGVALPGQVGQDAAQKVADTINQIARSADKKPLPPQTLTAIETSLAALRDQLTTGGAQTRVVRSAADAALSALHHTRQALNGQAIPVTTTEALAGRPDYARTAGLAEVLVQLAGTTSVPAVPVPTPNVKDAVNANNATKDAEAVRGMNSLIDKASAFELDASRYK